MAGDFTRIFLLSPAHSAGQRARLLMRPGATFELARRLPIRDTTLGEVFAFCSGLYFRGKLAYAGRFARVPKAAANRGVRGSLVITSSDGLMPAEREIGFAEMNKFAAVPVDPAEPRFTQPLQRSVRSLVRTLEATGTTSFEFVLLGSIATGKYVEVLLPLLGEHLQFPPDFVGRGDLSRGGLMLQCVREGVELPYLPVANAVRQGTRAPRLEEMFTLPTRDAGLKGSSVHR